MTIELSTDLIQRIQLHIQSGTGNSPEEVMRKALDVLDSRTAEVVAIQQGYEDYLAGKVVPLQEFDQDFRQQNSIPLDS